VAAALYDDSASMRHGRRCDINSFMERQIRWRDCFLITGKTKLGR